MFHLFLRRHVAATSGLQPQTHTHREVTNMHRVGAEHHLTINAAASTTLGAMRTALACSRACEMRARALLLFWCTRRMTKHTLASPRHDTLQPDADRGDDSRCFHLALVNSENCRHSVSSRADSCCDITRSQ